MCDGGEPIGIAQRLSNFVRVVAFYLISAVWLPIIIMVALVRPGPRYYPLVRAWARFTLRWFGIDVVVGGHENLEPGRDYVVLANHRSHFDSLALIVAFADRETRWVAKRELERVPIFGYGLRATGQILIDRSNRQSAIEELRRHLGQRGASVVFFPEGRRAPGRDLLPFKKGGAAFAAQAGLPILPVAISGSERVLPRESMFVRPGVIHLTIGAPLDAGTPESADRDAVLARVRDTIVAMLAQTEARPSADGGSGGRPSTSTQRTTHV
jgi:1-acyl-sn-glycerol-3-phosphate acyltransferase